MVRLLIGVNIMGEATTRAFSKIKNRGIDNGTAGALGVKLSRTPIATICRATCTATHCDLEFSTIDSINMILTKSRLWAEPNAKHDRPTEM